MPKGGWALCKAWTMSVANTKAGKETGREMQGLPRCWLFLFVEKMWKWLWPRQKKLKCSLFFRNTGISPSLLNFLLQKITEKRDLQNQLAPSVKLKLWRRRASLRKKMRRIYLQSLKRGENPLGWNGNAFSEQFNTVLKTWQSQTYWVLSPVSVIEEEVEMLEWAGPGSFTAFMSMMDCFPPYHCTGQSIFLPLIPFDTPFSSQESCADERGGGTIVDMVRKHSPRSETRPCKWSYT